MDQLLEELKTDEQIEAGSGGDGKDHAQIARHRAFTDLCWRLGITAEQLQQMDLDDVVRYLIQFFGYKKSMNLDMLRKSIETFGR